jgi:hypothetical protein
LAVNERLRIALYLQAEGGQPGFGTCSYVVPAFGGFVDAVTPFAFHEIFIMEHHSLVDEAERLEIARTALRLQGSAYQGTMNFGQEYGIQVQNGTRLQCGRTRLNLLEYYLRFKHTQWAPLLYDETPRSERRDYLIGSFRLSGPIKSVPTAGDCEEYLHVLMCQFKLKLIGTTRYLLA